MYALVPSVIAIVQGVEEAKSAHTTTTLMMLNETNATTAYAITSAVTQAMVSSPSSSSSSSSKQLFSVSSYFMIMASLSWLGSLCFVLLNNLKLVKHESAAYVSRKRIDDELEMSAAELVMNAANVMASGTLNPNAIHHNQHHADTKVATTTKGAMSAKRRREIRIEKAVLIVLAFFICFIYYGILPGIQSYSTLPYGVHVFHLSINLSCVRFLVINFFTFFVFLVGLFLKEFCFYSN